MNEIELRVLNEEREINIAISVRGAYKNYGSNTVLKNLYMEIQEGHIYVLLGASGCGKTSLLTAIVGLTKLNSGSIQIFGNDLKSKDSGIPGSRVGFMPQETALFEEFTAVETLNFFGRIFGIKQNILKERIKELLELLDMKEHKNKFIRDLSGGQKRRISFAATLIHEPPILILDEPTVGLDPLLRKSIWDYITKLNSTIIITTHYIGNAYQADRIGLMRNGRLIIEDNPDFLQDKFQTSLEILIIQACAKDENVDDFNEKLLNENAGKSQKKIIWNKKDSKLRTRLAGLLEKNFIAIWRNIKFILFILMFPAVCSIMAGFSFQPLKNVKIGYVNYENVSLSTCPEQLLCVFEDLSCNILDSLKSLNFDMIEYQTEEEALEDSKMALTKGYFIISENFSLSIAKLSRNQIKNSENLIIGRFDMSNEIMISTIIHSVYLATNMLLINLREECDIELPSFNIIEYDYALYKIKGNFGDVDQLQYIGISVTGLLALVCSLVSSSLTLIQEKKSGINGRCLSSGITLFEIYISHFICKYIILSLQMTIGISIMFWFWEISIQGSYILFILINALIQFTGLSIGFLMSSICSNESNAAQLTIAILYPIIALSACIWPLEGFSEIMKPISYIFSYYYPMEAFRAIVMKGLSINQFIVWMGFLVSFSHFILANVIIYLFSKR